MVKNFREKKEIITEGEISVCHAKQNQKQTMNVGNSCLVKTVCAVLHITNFRSRHILKDYTIDFATSVLRDIKFSDY